MVTKTSLSALCLHSLHSIALLSYKHEPCAILRCLEANKLLTTLHALEKVQLLIRLDLR